MNKRNKLLKKGMSFLLILIMAFSMIPMTAFADSTDKITVYVTISLEGQFQLSKDGITGMVEVPITLDKGSTAFDALVEAHKLHHEDGASGLNANENKSISKFWGKTSTSIGYFANGKMVMNIEEPLSDGDDIEGTVYKDWASDTYARFDKQSATVTAGGALPIALLSNVITTPDWKGGMMAGESANQPLAGAKILVSDSASCNIPYDGSKNWVTDEKGKAVISFESPGTYYISAEKEGKNLIPPICKVTVTAPVTDEEKAQIVGQDKNALSFEDFKGQNTSVNEVERNLDLPNSGNSGKTSILWTSEDESVIKSDGTVIRPVGANKTVKMTAQIAYGSISDTKSFDITVKAYGTEEVESLLNDAVTKLPSKITPKEWDGDFQKDKNIVALVREELAKINTSIKVSDICTPGEQTQITENGDITYGSKRVKKDVIFSLELGGVTKEYKANVTVNAKSATKVEALSGDWITFDLIKNLNTTNSEIVSDLNLPKEDSKGYYTEIEWTSSDSNIISIGDYTVSGKFTAKVTRPKLGQQDAKVTLTAKINPGSYWSYGMAPGGPMPNPAYGEKTFNLIVPAVNQEEQKAAQNLVDEGIKLFNLDNIAVISTKEKANLQELTCNFNNVPYNWNYVDKLEGFKAAYRVIDVKWSSENPGIKKISTYGEVTRTSKDQTGDIVLTLYYNGATAEKRFPAKVIAGIDKNKETKDKIASVYADKNSEWWGASATWWHAVGMNAYENTSSDITKLISEDAKQAFINANISDIATMDVKASVNANKLANAINGMSAFGYDPTTLWTVNKTKIDAVSQLKNIKIEEAKKDWYSTIAPYVLLSLNQGEFNADTLKKEYIDYLLGELKNADWSYGIDVPAMILQGLAPYYTREDVKPEVDKVLSTLSQNQGESGSYGNANSDASVIIALAQLGINPDTDSRFIKNGKSLMDGLLTYKVPTNDGFRFGESDKSNELATQQGFLALIAASKVMESGQPYNIYDFSKVAKKEAYANGTGGKEVSPTEPVSEQEIKITFTLKADSGTWIPQTTVNVKSDATVYHAFTKVLDEKGFTYIGAKRGYVSSITNPSGTTLAEFTNGRNSGWLYTVNGSAPTIGLKDYKLNDGDKLVWYYTNDWTKDPEAVKAAGGKSAIAEFVEKEKASGKTEVQATTDKDGKASAEVKTKDISDAIEAVVKASEKAGATAKKEVKIVVKADDKAKEVETKLPKDSMVELNKKVDVVTVQTPLADIVFDKQNLELMSKNINGDVKLSVRKVDLAKEGNLSEESKRKIKEKVGDRPILDFNLTVGDKKISNFADNVQVSIPYTASQNENVNGIVVYYINDNGNLETIKDCQYDSKTKTLTFSTNHFSNYAVGYKNISFDDISKHWAKDQIVYLAARDVVKGVNNTGFAPNDKVTRAEFVQILANLSGADLSKYGDSKFKDVKKDVWFANSAAWAAELGLVTGNSNNDGTVSFNPNESITRQDMAVILSRYMTKIEQKKLSEVNKEVKFADKNQIGGYAESAVTELQKAGVINGKTTDSFAPKENATRAECSKMISVLMQNYL